jgi:hypothetical protein
MTLSTSTGNIVFSVIVTVVAAIALVWWLARVVRRK